MDHDLAGLVDCRSRVNTLSVSEDRTSKTARSPVPSDRILPMYSHIIPIVNTNASPFLGADQMMYGQGRIQDFGKGGSNHEGL